MKRWIKVIIVVVVFAAVAGAGAWYYTRAESKPVTFRTSQVKRDNLLVTIGATGSLEPEESIDVGAQVAGQIMSFGKDADGKAIDYNSRVEEGTILAQIDSSVYELAAAQAEASLQQAAANQVRSEADLGQLKAKQVQAQRDWERAQKLGPSEALSQSAYDGYESAFLSAQANVAVGEAAIVQAKAAVAQAQAAKKQAQRNLDYCTIKSPVNGVIIDRRVNIGQTVVASLNAPSLFLLAKDLKRMQVWVAVNEADIGKIYAGQAVTFTVDKVPGETFTGTVGKVRLNASMTQNVVTYTVEVLTDNSSGKLLPYGTANVLFEVNRRDNVLLAPNAALRWQPTEEQIAPEFRNKPPDADRAPAASRPATSHSAASHPGTGGAEQFKWATLWVAKGQFVQPLTVRAGYTDGVMTEVTGDGLSDGLVVVTGVQSVSADDSTSTNPFAPKLPGRGGRGGTGTGTTSGGNGGAGGTSGGRGGPGGPPQ